MLSAMRYSSVATPAPAPTTPLRCLVVDGDASGAAALAACVQQVPSLVLAGSYTCPTQALTYLRTHPVDVLFLPIELPLLAGLRLLQPQRHGPAVVLTSTYPDYSLQSYGAYGVVDYLRKPFCPVRFRQIAVRLHTQRAATATALPLRRPLSQPQTDSLYFWSKQQLVQIRTADLLYIEDLGGRTRLQTLHQELITETAFAALADQLLEPQFLRVNPTCTVAISHAIAAGNTLTVGGRRIAVGPALQDEVLARVFQTSVWSA